MTEMLWFDAEKGRTPEGRIHLAAAYFEKKYGCRPAVCYVPLSTLTQSEWAGITEVEGVRVEPRAFVLANHLQLGTPDGA